jgi:hypothetical protein
MVASTHFGTDAIAIGVTDIIEFVGFLSAVT